MYKVAPPPWGSMEMTVIARAHSWKQRRNAAGEDAN